MAEPIFGIDVSYAQGEIDWDNVANDGVKFAIIRAGYGMESN
jgi:GH25 family lysozyme M1 (1,4-beta-N-acetylmuramidase)